MKMVRSSDKEMLGRCKGRIKRLKGRCKRDFLNDKETRNDSVDQGQQM